MQIKSFDEFISFRNGLEIQRCDDLDKAIKENTFDLKDYELGIILEVLRFSPEDTLESITFDNRGFCNSDKVNQVKQKYDFKPYSPVSFIQGIDHKKLYEFINNWYKQKNKETKWNPDWIKSIVIDDNIRSYCQKNKLIDVIKEFDLTTDYERSSPYNNINKDYIIYPFDGWTLAECFKLSHPNL